MLSKNTGAVKKRVDFPNPETQKALKKLIEYLKNNFDLPDGENYQSVAEDAIVEAIQSPFVMSNTPLHEAIYKRALGICASFVGENEEEIFEQSEPEPDAEDIYNVIDSIKFSGSEKQIKWAADIAHKATADIIAVWKKKNLNLPTEAKWWIDNRNNIKGALLNL